jgi:excisionase family DNA binding protein
MTVLTHQEAAAFLKVNDATLRKLRRSGDIHGTLVGAQYRYIREDLEAFLNGVQVSVRPKTPEVVSGHPTIVAPDQSAIDRPRRAVHHRPFYSVHGKGSQ